MTSSMTREAQMTMNDAKQMTSSMTREAQMTTK
jgi:hypothetical protein